jgi:putative peptidoglycan lipid II flippase
VTNERTGRAAFLVAVGIFTSRIAGLVRQSVFAHFFGASLAADAFQAAFRIPNMLQNLFGEGVLSATFIPEYAGLLAKKDPEKAREVAGAVFAALALTAAILALLGVLFAPYLVDLLAGGFDESQRELTTTLVRILFPGAALLVLSAWCLGVLNSHRRFLLSYMAPLAWNAMMIGALVLFGPTSTQAHLAVVLAWASVIGSAAQFAVQLPTVFKLAGAVKPKLHFALEETRRVFRNFTAAFLSRGVVQISALIDLFLATHLPVGAVAALAYGQTLYMLPGSLFGMSVSAAELPAMSSVLGTTDEIAAKLRERLKGGMERISYFVVPCVVGFIALGDVIIAAIFQTGRFQRTETVWVWQILIGSTVGLLASTLGRLITSTYYALRDTKTPLKFAIVRITLTTLLGVLFAFGVPKWLGIDPRYGAVGLTISAGIAGWVEFALLRRGLVQRIGAIGFSGLYLGKLWIAAIVAAVLAWLVRVIVPAGAPIIYAIFVLGVYGIGYLALTAWYNIPDAQLLIAKLRSRARV